MNQYTKIVYNFFNTATVQAYKWKFNKGGRVSNAHDAYLHLHITVKTVTFKVIPVIAVTLVYKDLHSVSPTLPNLQFIL